MKNCSVFILSSLLFVWGCVPQNEHHAEEPSVETPSVEQTTSAITSQTSSIIYQKALVRLDFPGGRCSGFLIAPNMIVTAAHCIDDPGFTGTITASNGKGIRWRNQNVRIVYKPSTGFSPNHEVICLNEPCWNAGSPRTIRRTTVRVWWDAGFAGSSDPASDFAIITRVQGLPFPSRPNVVGEPNPRALSDSNGDFLRILKHRAPGSHLMWAAGYGFISPSGTSTTSPRRGQVFLDWWGPYHVVGDQENNDVRMCQGDSGGPLIYPNDRQYAIGLLSNMDVKNNGDLCAKVGGKQRWTRVSSKRWMINRILQWAGEPDCRQFHSQSLPNEGLYLRCW